MHKAVGHLKKQMKDRFFMFITQGTLLF